VQGQRLYMQVDGLAVTPGGQDGFVVGNYSESLSGLVDSRPFLAKYSASTGAFLKGYNFDRDETRLGVGVAVDPTGQHVYVGDERNPFVGRTTARVYEVDVSRLHEARRFRLAGNDLCCDLAITPDGHLFAQVGPPHTRRSCSRSTAPARVRRSPAAWRWSDPRHRHSRRVRARSPTCS
jgi:hypothetical protein